MIKCFGLTFLAFVVSVQSCYVQRTLWPATKACQTYHYEKFERYADSEDYYVEGAGKYSLRFDVTQLDKPFILYHDRRAPVEKFTDFLFDLHQRKSRVGAEIPDDQLSSDDIEPLTFDQRPKLYVTKDGSTTEYSLKYVEIELPLEIYDNDNHSPNYVDVDLYFSKRDTPNSDYFYVEYPVYAADLEEGTGIDAVFGKFLNDLGEDRRAKGHPVVRDLKILQGGLESVNNAVVPVYSLPERNSLIALGACQYVEENSFDRLYRNHHIHPHGC